jgi:hypothetical protein
MCHERLREVKEVLLCAVEEQVECLSEVNTKELGEVIDMIKDLEEAIYYCTVTEAMNTPTWEMKKSDHHQGPDDSRMYQHDSMMRDIREGRSHMSRKMYMEARDMNKDKTTQLRELEKYMQELSQDITEMIAEASLDEKQYLEKKITALASKIGQMK